MSLSAALAQIQRPSWLAEAPPDWASNAARNARYAAEREALRAAIARAGKSNYQELQAASGLSSRTMGNYLRTLAAEGSVITYRSGGQKFAEAVR